MAMVVAVIAAKVPRGAAVFCFVVTLYHMHIKRLPNSHGLLLLSIVNVNAKHHIIAQSHVPWLSLYIDAK